MQFITDFFQAYAVYIKELFVPVTAGFFISGIFYEFIPTDFVQKHLSQKSIKPLLISSVVGVILPVCCFGSLPIAMTLRRKGAPLGPVLAFLVATPATSISALFVSWKLLGSVFTFYIFGVVILMGLIVGALGNCLRFSLPKPLEDKDNCCEDQALHNAKGPLPQRVKRIFHYAFIRLPKDIGFELLAGVAIASLIVVYDPIQDFIHRYFAGGLGYAMIVAVGLATYVCSTASVPMADAMIQSGMTVGQGMTYLLIGPITSYGMILVLHKEFGGKVLSLYLMMITILSLIFGIIFDFYF